MEKLANHIALQSIAEGGMEKQAMNVLQLLRMGRNFALRGKMDRFNTLMDRRAYAAADRILKNNRINAARDAGDKYNQVVDYLSREEASPVLRKRRFAENRIVNDPVFIPRNMNPEDRVAFERDLTKYLDYLRDVSPSTRNLALSGTPSYNHAQLASFNRALKQLDPWLHEKVLTTGSF